MPWQPGLAPCGMGVRPKRSDPLQPWDGKPPTGPSTPQSLPRSSHLLELRPKRQSARTRVFRSVERRPKDLDLSMGDDPRQADFGPDDADAALAAGSPAAESAAASVGPGNGTKPSTAAPDARAGR